MKLDDLLSTIYQARCRALASSPVLDVTIVCTLSPKAYHDIISDPAVTGHMYASSLKGPMTVHGARILRSNDVTEEEGAIISVIL